MNIKNMYDTGYKLELFTNACFQTLDYYIDTNLKVTEDKVSGKGKIDILEIDIFAKKFNHNTLSTTLVECKRGCNFNDLFLFSGVSNSINADINIMVILSKQIEEIKQQAEILNIIILEPLELYKSVPEKNIKIFNMFYSWNDFKHSIMSKEFITSELMKNSTKKLSKYQKEAYGDVRAFHSLINGKIWREPDLINRANSFSELFHSHRDFVRKIARTQKIKPANKNSQYYVESNEICQAAGALILDVKIAYIICAVECAILGINVESVKDVKFQHLVAKLLTNIEIAVLIPKFLQYFINIFGGMYANYDEDIANICATIQISKQEFNDIISLLKKLFVLPEIGIQWGFEESLLVVSLKKTPSIYKAVGISNRKALGFNTGIFVLEDEWEVKLINWEDNYEIN